MPDDRDSLSSTTVDDGPDARQDDDGGPDGSDDGPSTEATSAVGQGSEPEDSGDDGVSIFAGDSDEYDFAFDVGSDTELTEEETAGPATSSVSVYAEGWADEDDDVGYDDEGYDDEPAGIQRPVPQARLSRREKRRRVKLQARRVRRVVRHVEPWSVFKISVFFYLCLWFVFLVAGLILWSFATSSGTVENFENLITELFALEEFTFDSEQIFRGFALAGVVLMIGGTIFNVLVCVLFNLLSDLTGGLRITMIEEESIRPMPPPRPPRRRRSSRNARRRRR